MDRVLSKVCGPNMMAPTATLYLYVFVHFGLIRSSARCPGPHEGPIFAPPGRGQQPYVRVRPQELRTSVGRGAHELRGAGGAVKSL